MKSNLNHPFTNDYLKQVSTIPKASLWLKIRLFFVVLLTFGSTLILFYFFEKMINNDPLDSDPTASNKSMIGDLIFQLIIFALMVLLIVIGAFRRRRPFFKALNEGIFVDFPQHLFKSVPYIVFPLSIRMGIRPERLTLLYSYTNDAVPSVVEHKKNIYVVIPRSVVLLSTDKPEQFKSLIAHEFGHIIQRDSNLWLNIRAIILPFCTVLVFNVIVNSIIFPMFAYGWNFYTWPGNIISGAVFSMYWKMRLIEWFKSGALNISKHSEYLADMAVVAFADGIALIKFLESIKHEPVVESESTYPDLTHRLENLEKMILTKQEIDAKFIAT